MKLFESLRRRIIVAHLLYACGFVLFFSVIAAFAVEGIEEHLVDNRLRQVAAWAAPRHAGGLPVALPAGLSFHHGANIPSSLRGLPPGVWEMEVDGVGLQVLAGRDAAGEYVVVDHASDYEQVELVVYSMFGIGFVGFLLFSVFLGGYVARRVVTPISALATAVQSDASKLPLLERADEIGVLARAFEAHSSELRRVLERERFFTGDVSHELRSPLAVIMGAAEVLMQQAGNPAAYATAERIYRAAKQEADFIAVLLLLARSPEPGTLAAQPALPLAQVAEDATARCQALLAGKPVTLSFAGGADFLVAGPRELWAAAIGNLVRNACQYTEQGQVTVRLAPGCVTVEDSGPGLPAEVRAALAGSALPASSGSAGTGLGLSLVQRICAALGATLSLADRPGGGSIFTIRFPGAS